MYTCARACACTLLTTSAALWTVGIRNSKLPPFLPDKNTPSFICFSCQPCLGAPSPLLGRKNNFRPQSSNTHVKLSLDTNRLMSFHFSFRSFGADFFETARVGNKHRCRWSSVSGPVLPARWTAVRRHYLRWALTSSVCFLKPIWHPGKQCVWSFWCCHSTQRANHPASAAHTSEPL